MKQNTSTSEPNTHPIVHQDAQHRQHHAEDVHPRDRIAEDEQRHGNDEDALRGAGHRVRERRHQRQHAERNDVLQPVEHAVGEQECDDAIVGAGLENAR